MIISFENKKHPADTDVKECPVLSSDTQSSLSSSHSNQNCLATVSWGGWVLCSVWLVFVHWVVVMQLSSLSSSETQLDPEKEHLYSDSQV